jgi:putative PIN family toxin of toxin-antitoxin system
VRIVLDTNIWLDWFVFNDPTINTLKTWSAKPENTIVIDEACKQELISVLAYEKFSITVDRQREISEMIDDLCSFHIDGTTEHQVWCKDPQDEKFILLALCSKSEFLITKDLHLLKRKNYRIRSNERSSLKIVRPKVWSDLISNQ